MQIISILVLLTLLLQKLWLDYSCCNCGQMTWIIFILYHHSPTNSCLMRRSRIAKRMNRAEWVPALLHVFMVALCRAVLGVVTDSRTARLTDRTGGSLPFWRRLSTCLLIDPNHVAYSPQQVVFQCVVRWTKPSHPVRGYPALNWQKKLWLHYNILYLLWSRLNGSWL